MELPRGKRAGPRQPTREESGSMMGCSKIPDPLTAGVEVAGSRCRRDFLPSKLSRRIGYRTNEVFYDVARLIKLPGAAI
jgi:hypothetical protein